MDVFTTFITTSMSILDFILFALSVARLHYFAKFLIKKYIFYSIKCQIIYVFVLIFLTI